MKKISNIATFLSGNISESHIREIEVLIKAVYEQLYQIHGDDFDYESMFIKIYNYEESQKLIYKTNDSFTVITNTLSGFSRFANDTEIIVKSNHFDETQTLSITQLSDGIVIMDFDINYELYHDVININTAIGLIPFLKRCLSYFKKTSLMVHGV